MSAVRQRADTHSPLMPISFAIAISRQPTTAAGSKMNYCRLTYSGNNSVDDPTKAPMPPKNSR